MTDFFSNNSIFGTDKLDLFQFAVLNPQIAMLAYLKVGQEILKQPNKMEQAQKNFINRLFDLQKDFANELYASEKDCIDLSYDKYKQKFDDNQFQNHPIIKFSQKFHDTISEWMLDTLSTIENVEPSVMHSARFFMKQYINMMSPNNFPFLNPDFWKETIDSGGENIQKGIAMLIEDIKNGAITTNDKSKYEVGKNLAATPGKVVYQNDIIELIQYSPSTKQVFLKPLLIVPPWINKFYILDLNAETSFVKWTVDNGFTVFMISWINPDKRHRYKGFEDYISEGLMDSIDKIYEITKSNAIHAFGYCVGGTLISALLAYLAHTKCKRRPLAKIESATLLTTLLDFDKAGDMSIFMGDNYMDIISAQLKEKGYLDGQIMFNTFSALKPNDMIWRYYINSYMLGKKPQAHDMLYWNSDPTNLTESMQLFLAKDLYRDNLLKTGNLKIFGTAIDLKKVTTPIYMISMIKDHLVPWKATFDGIKLFGGNIRFVLGGSGHVAGAINHPSKKKYNYWINEQYPNDANEWLKNASEFAESWWNDWLKWITPMMGKMIEAKEIKNCIRDAPGIYVHNKISDSNE